MLFRSKDALRVAKAAGGRRQPTQVGGYNFHPEFGSDREALMTTAYAEAAGEFKKNPEMRQKAIPENSVFRAMTNPDNNGNLLVYSRLEDDAETPAYSWDATDKHKLVWLCTVAEARKTICTTVKTKGRGTTDWERLWHAGSLHVIENGFKQDYSWLVRVKPKPPSHDDYVCVVLSWIGNHIFYHDALRKAMNMK